MDTYTFVSIPTFGLPATKSSLALDEALMLLGTICIDKVIKAVKEMIRSVVWMTAVLSTLMEIMQMSKKNDHNRWQSTTTAEHSMEARPLK